MDVEFPTDFLPGYNSNYSYCYVFPPGGSIGLVYVYYHSDLYTPYNAYYNVRASVAFHDGNFYLIPNAFANAGQVLSYQKYQEFYDEGNCLNQTGLVYKPEYKDFIFPMTSFIIVIFIFWLVYRVIIKRLLP